MDRIELLSRPFPVRLVWVGPLTVVTSIAVVLVVRIAAVALLRPPPEFTPLGWDSPIVLTGAPGATWPNADAAHRRESRIIDAAFRGLRWLGFRS